MSLLGLLLCGLGMGYAVHNHWSNKIKLVCERK